MLKAEDILKTLQNQRGVSAVIVAICIFMLVGFAALAIDIGYLYTTRNELQNVADAGALAGAGYLGSVYETLSYSDQQGYTFARDYVVNAVNEVAQKNKAANSSIRINNDDIIIGNWNGSSVDPTLIQPDAVKVAARRSSIANSPVVTIFARIFGTNAKTVDINADTTAALTGPIEVEEGELKVPFSLSDNIFSTPCTDLISFYPTTNSCAGWHNFGELANASKMAEKMFEIVQGDRCQGCGTTDSGDQLLSGNDWLEANFDLNQTPDGDLTDAFQSDDPLDHTGGTVASLFNGAALDPSSYDGNTADGYTEPTVNPKNPAPFQALFDYFRYRDGDATFDENGNIIKNDEIWTATVPVYKEESIDCFNPSGDMKISFFTKIIITIPNPPPDKTVSVTLDCNKSFIPGRGGGGLGNLRGTIPNIVE